MDGPNRLLRSGLMIEELRARGHNVVWVASTFDHFRKCQRYPARTEIPLPHERLILLHGCRYERNISAARLLNHLQLAFDFHRWAASEKVPDVILTSMPTIELSFAAVKFGALHRIPVVMDIRDLWPDIFTAGLRSPMKMLIMPYIKLYRALLKWSLRRTAAIWAVSEGYLEWGLEVAGLQKRPLDTVFPLGYMKPNWEEFKPQKTEEWLSKRGIDLKRKICWFIGSFGRTYDLETIIDAAKVLAQKGRNDIQFILSGDGEKVAVLKKKAEGLDNVLFTGWIKKSEIGHLMKVASVGLAAYDARAPQSIPNKIAEYMCCGLPILSSLKGETEALLLKTGSGLSYESGSPESFLGKLLELFSNEAVRKRMSVRAQETFARDFDAKIIYRESALSLENIVTSFRKIVT